MNRIIISKFKKHKNKRGYWYKLECLKCKITFELQGYKFNEGKGKYCSPICTNSCEEHLKNVRKAQKKINKHGKNNPNWRGGKSPFWLYQRYRKNHCAVCGRSNEEVKRSLEAHHIDQNRSNNNPKNITTLCPSCHKKIHKPWKDRKRMKGKFI